VQARFYHPRFVEEKRSMSSAIYETQVETLDGQKKDLSDYQGKVVLVVNTASKCAFTPQYEGLEKLYEKYKDRGLVILGFPCNQFGKQEAGSNAEIGEFCMKNYGVSFPMHAKVEVNGDNAHPLFKRLKSEAKGILGTQNIKWNFTKFLIDRKGTIVGRFSPRTKPEDLEKEILPLLG
jgi:glutathione peroxidase